MNAKEWHAVQERLARQLIEQGSLIEAGWVSMRQLTLPQDTPKDQLEQMRETFFAGAQHVFGSMMTMLEAGDDPTSADLRRMKNIAFELEEFIKEYSRKHGLQSSRPPDHECR